jgi:hypothetical protein
MAESNAKCLLQPLRTAGASTWGSRRRYSRRSTEDAPDLSEVHGKASEIDGSQIEAIIGRGRTAEVAGARGNDGQWGIPMVRPTEVFPTKSRTARRRPSHSWAQRLG